MIWWVCGCDLRFRYAAGQRLTGVTWVTAITVAMGAGGGFPGDSAGIMGPMTIFLDDADTYLVARSRRDMLDALLDHLDGEPEAWQLQMIAAACLGHREPLAVVVQEV